MPRVDPASDLSTAREADLVKALDTADPNFTTRIHAELVHRQLVSMNPSMGAAVVRAQPSLASDPVAKATPITIDIADLTDEQLKVLATSGDKSKRDAAIAELGQRQVDDNYDAEQAETPAAVSKARRSASRRVSPAKSLTESDVVSLAKALAVSDARLETVMSPARAESIRKAAANPVTRDQLCKALDEAEPKLFKAATALAESGDTSPLGPLLLSHAYAIQRLRKSLKTGSAKPRRDL